MGGVGGGFFLGSRCVRHLSRQFEDAEMPVITMRFAMELVRNYLAGIWAME